MDFTKEQAPSQAECFWDGAPLFQSGEKLVCPECAATYRIEDYLVWYEAGSRTANSAPESTAT